MIIRENHNGAALAYVDPYQYRTLLDDLKNHNSELTVQLATSQAETHKAHLIIPALDSQLEKSKEATSTAEEELNIKESKIQSLKETITEHSTNSRKAVQEIGTLKEEIKSKEPLFKVRVAVRSAWFETSTRVWPCGMNLVRKIPDLDLISAKNDATHRGNSCADRSLFKIGIFKTDAQKKEFLHAQGIPETDQPDSVAIEIFNMRGSLIACGYQTKYTHSKKDDEYFATDFEVSAKLYHELKDYLNMKKLSDTDFLEH